MWSRLRPRRAAARRLEPVTFAPVHKVFKPQVKVTAQKDISGWVVDDGVIGPKHKSRRRVKMALQAGKTYYIDEPTARAWIAKGYVTGDLDRPLSEDEVAEYQSQVTTIGLGENNG